MPSNNFQSIPINKKPDVILSIFENDDRFIGIKRRDRAKGNEVENCQEIRPHGLLGYKTSNEYGEYSREIGCEKGAIN